MNTIFFSTIFTGIILCAVCSFEMETVFVKTEKRIQWTIKNLNELNFMTHTTSYGSNRLESSPFFPFENSRDEWVIGLVTSGARLSYGPVVDLYIRSLDSKRTSDQIISGTVTFRNLTKHALYECPIRESALMWDGAHPPKRMAPIVSPVKLLDMFEKSKVPSGGMYLPEVMEKLNNVLMLDFSLNIVAPFTAFIN